MGKHDKTGKNKELDFDIAESKEEKKSARKKWWIVLGVLVGIYAAGVVLFHYVFVPNTSFDGYGFSFKKPEAIDQMMADDTKNRVITIKKIDGEESIFLHDEVDYVKSATPPVGGWINNITAWKWPIYIFAKNELGGNVKVDYNVDKLDDAINALDAMQKENIRPPKDAELVREGDVYVINPEDDGNKIIVDKFMTIFKSKITESDETINLEEEGCYEKPKIRKDDPNLLADYEEYKSVNFQRIGLDMSDATEELETPDILKLFYADGELSEEKVREYVQDLKERFDTYERGRMFENSYGEWISVGTISDTYGFRINEDETVTRLYEILESKESADTEPVWRNKGLVRGETNDIGENYIEVSIDNQMLWAYLNGEKVIESRVVTGRDGKYATPRGVFSIMQKATDTRLKGKDKDTDEEWDSPVSYWMLLTWAGAAVGLHDASWRSEFGGQIYHRNGSHGCVNMPYSVAQFLYNNYDYGYPTVIW